MNRVTTNNNHGSKKEAINMKFEAINMKFSERNFLRGLRTIPNWRRDWIRKDLDPQEYNKIFNFYKVLYEAAMAHPDWDSDGEQAFCVDEYSPQRTPKKLLAWYRAKRGTAQILKINEATKLKS